MISDERAPEYKYIAYIDESGDPGVKRVKPRDTPGSSEWLVVSAVVIAANREAETEDWSRELTAAAASRQLRELHFAKLQARSKLAVCQVLASKPVRCFTVVSNKQNMRGHRNPLAEKIPSDNWFYCWMTRLLLERVTHWVHRRSVREFGSAQKVRLVYSERGGLSYAQMNAYYEWLRMKGDNQVLKFGNLHYDTIDMRLMEVVNHTASAGLKLPDIVASAFFKGVDLYDTGAVDPAFAMALRPRMARALYGSNRLIAGYGVKLMPGLRPLLKRGVAAEQLALLRHYGYPAQWWEGGPRPVYSAA